MTKINLRKKILKERKKDFFKEEIINNLMIFLDSFNNIGLYYPIKEEINIIPFIEKILVAKTIYLPFCNPEMTFRKVKELNNLVKDYYGILSPSSPPTNLNNLEVIVVPALAINQQGYRLGYGKGCYDKMLSNFNGVIAGLVYEKYLIDDLFQEPHDQKVDYIITETRIVKVK